jgi:hypothetical protein
MKIPLAILILFCTYNLASACSCKMPDDADKDKALQIASVVFQGKVVSTSPSWFSESSDIKVRFRVSRAWKGVEASEIIVKTSAIAGTCGYSFKEDSTYIVYANDDPPWTSTCTMQLVDETRIRQSFGEGRVFEDSPAEPENIFIWIWRKISPIFP